MLTAAGTAVGEAGVDAVARADDAAGGHEVGGREAELAPAAVAADDRRRAARTGRRAAPPRAPPRRRRSASGSGSRRRSRRRPRAARTTRVAKRPSAASSAASPCAPAPKRKFSPTETARAREALDQHLVDELLRALRAAKAASKRTTISSCDAERGDDVGLDRERREQPRHVRGRDHRDRVGLEGQHACRRRAITSRWPDVDAVEGADRERRAAAARRRSSSVSCMRGEA